MIIINHVQLNCFLQIIIIGVSSCHYAARMCKTSLKKSIKGYDDCSVVHFFKKRLKQIVKSVFTSSYNRQMVWL